MFYDKNGKEIKENMKLKCINEEIKSEYNKIEKVIIFDNILYFDGEKSIFPLSEFASRNNILEDYEIID